jgi:magnesium-transporting ATPase (P-type)
MSSSNNHEMVNRFPSSTPTLRTPLVSTSSTSTTSSSLTTGLAEPLLFVDEDTSSRIDNVHSEVKTRLIHVNNPMANAPFKYRKNKISTTKYNLISFIPKNLFEQFRRIANLYFLFIAILQLIPGLSPTGRFTTIMPLTIVLCCSAIKDAFEDVKRRNSDRVTNGKRTLILRDGRFVETKWRDVGTGDIIKVTNKEAFPADIVILSTSEKFGICYVETSSLDGYGILYLMNQLNTNFCVNRETNLKIRRGRPETLHITSEIEASQFTATIKSEQPNNRLYNFEGTMTISNDVIVSLDPDNILLRVCIIINLLLVEIHSSHTLF